MFVMYHLDGSNIMKTIANDTFFAWVEAELAEGRPVRFCLKGNSMFPLLRNGKDTVILEKCNQDTLKPMDVVLFRYKGNHVLHRILRRENNQLLIQGDGSFVAKEQCTVDDVVGKVVQVCRPSGKVLSVDSWQWRLPSRLWRLSNPLRVFLLRLGHLCH
jgi:hypothetical protein